MQFKLFFIGCLFIGPLFSWSQEMKTVKGVMEKKSSDKFFLSIKNCSIPIHRGVLKKTPNGRVMDSYVESNWEEGQTLNVAVPSGAVEDAECRDDLGVVADVDQRFQVSSPGYESRPPSYECDSSEYRALKARVEAFNSRGQENENSIRGGSMDLPSCTGDAGIPDCDSEEYQEAEREAQRTGNPIGPCRESRDDDSQRMESLPRRGSRGVR